MPVTWGLMRAFMTALRQKQDFWVLPRIGIAHVGKLAGGRLYRFFESPLGVIPLFLTCILRVGSKPAKNVSVCGRLVFILNLSSLKRGLCADRRRQANPLHVATVTLKRSGTVRRRFSRQWGRSVGKRRVHTRIP